MNVETRQIKFWEELTDEEKKSGQWKRLETGMAEWLGTAQLFRDTYVTDALSKQQQLNSFQRKLVTPK